VRQAGHIVHVGKIKQAYQLLGLNFERKRLLGKYRHRSEDYVNKSKRGGV
jgi:hypothetical protein